MPSTIDLVIALSLEVLKRSFAGISGIIKTIKKNNANDLSSLIGKMLRVDVHNIISTSSTTMLLCLSGPFHGQSLSE